MYRFFALLMIFIVSNSWAEPDLLDGFDTKEKKEEKKPSNDTEKKDNKPRSGGVKLPATIDSESDSVIVVYQDGEKVKHGNIKKDNSKKSSTTNQKSSKYTSKYSTVSNQKSNEAKKIEADIAYLEKRLNENTLLQKETKQNLNRLRREGASSLSQRDYISQLHRYDESIKKIQMDISKLKAELNIQNAKDLKQREYDSAKNDKYKSSK